MQAKSQVTVQYVDGKPVGVTQIVLSTQHVDEDLSSADVRHIVEPYIRKTLPEGWISDETVWHVNPTGKFVIGGPDGDCGLTGRKIIVDTYGGAAPHGGGAFSGKDPTKVDRSAAYVARYLAKNVVAAGLADRCTIQPLLCHRRRRNRCRSTSIRTATGKVPEEKLEEVLGSVMRLSPRGIREHLKLNRPHLRPHLVLRPLRSQARLRRRLLLGEHRPRRQAQGRRRGVMEEAFPSLPGGRRDNLLRGRRVGKPLSGYRRELDGRAAAFASRSTRRSRSILRRCSPGLSPISASRSASAAASTCWPPPSVSPTLASSAASPSSTAWRGRWAELATADLDNIRLHCGDAGEIVDALPDACLGRVYLYYPDPWPKRRQQKRRFVSEDILARLARAMRPGAELRFATDIDAYCGWTLGAPAALSPDFRWTAAEAGTGSGPGPTGCTPATRPRPSPRGVAAATSRLRDPSSSLRHRLVEPAPPWRPSRRSRCGSRNRARPRCAMELVERKPEIEEQRRLERIGMADQHEASLRFVFSAQVDEVEDAILRRAHRVARRCRRDRARPRSTGANPREAPVRRSSGPTS